MRAFGSQTTGELLWIDASATPLTATATVHSAATALAVVRGWLSTHPSVYQILDPVASLDAHSSAYDSASRTLRFNQYQNGIPILGKYGIARFSPRGELISLVTRLVPAPAQTQGARPGGLSPRAWRVGPVTQGEISYRLVTPILERNGIQVIRKLLDPETGETLESWDETPSELASPPSNWRTSGKAGRYSAPDSLGTLLQIPSVIAGSVLTLGFSVAGVHALGEANTIADVGGPDSRRDVVPHVPLGTLAQQWAQEPAYPPYLRAATRLALHLETTQRWFLGNLGRASWDGEGGSFHAAIRGNRDPDGKPQFNAWGSNGMILVGDGPSPSGQFVTDALDIVAHEFTHSVIDATAALEYHDEVGALNESLADFFGKCVQGFGDPIVGHEAGAHMRDILHPADCVAPEGQPTCRQPARYGEFRLLPLDRDHGGVHVNSAIISLPLARAAQATGVLPLARLVHDHLEHGRLSTESNLEEYAAALSAHCLELDSRSICKELEARFTESELLRRI